MDSVSGCEDNSLGMFKCKKCRADLFSGSIIVSSHKHVPLDRIPSDDCPANYEMSSLYIDDSNDRMPPWMKEQIDSQEWVKGKFICPTAGCGARIGSFNFVNGQLCPCRQVVAPRIHILRKRIDYNINSLPGNIIDANQAVS